MEHFDLKSKWHLEYFHTCKDNPSEYPFVRHISIHAVFLMLYFHQSLREVARFLHHFYPYVGKAGVGKHHAKRRAGDRDRSIQAEFFVERRNFFVFLFL